MFYLILVFVMFFSFCPQVVRAQQLDQQRDDPMVEAQEKLLNAKGSYKTIKGQEKAIKDMKKATKLSLRAAKLRAKAEVLQIKADVLVHKANQAALSRGLYITNPSAAVQLQSASAPPPSAGGATSQTANAPSYVPVPGRPINIIIPKDEEVSYQDNFTNTP